jgi:DNA-binding MarR family transcriptional regulator
MDENGKESAEMMLVRELAETFPLLMSRIRATMRNNAKGQMTVAQLRILGSLYQESRTVTDLAEWQGVSAPAMSKMVDVLEKKGWIERGVHSQDRRQVGLKLTSEGRKRFLDLRKQSQIRIAERLAKASDSDKQLIRQALTVLNTMYR